MIFSERLLAKPRGLMVSIKTCLSQVMSASGVGHIQKIVGSTFSACLREVQFKNMQASNIFHLSGHRSSCIKPNGERGGIKLRP